MTLHGHFTDSKMQRTNRQPNTTKMESRSRLTTMKTPPKQRQWWPALNKSSCKQENCLLITNVNQCICLQIRVVNGKTTIRSVWSQNKLQTALVIKHVRFVVRRRRWTLWISSICKWPSTIKTKSVKPAELVLTVQDYNKPHRLHKPDRCRHPSHKNWKWGRLRKKSA